MHRPFMPVWRGISSGLYEFYITVPSGLPNGDYQVIATQNGIALPQTMYLTLGN